MLAHYDLFLNHERNMGTQISKSFCTKTTFRYVLSENTVDLAGHCFSFAWTSSRSLDMMYILMLAELAKCLRVTGGYAPIHARFLRGSKPLAKHESQILPTSK